MRNTYNNTTYGLGEIHKSITFVCTCIYIYIYISTHVHKCSFVSIIGINVCIYETYMRLLCIGCGSMVVCVCVCDDRLVCCVLELYINNALQSKIKTEGISSYKRMLRLLHALHNFTPRKIGA